MGEHGHTPAGGEHHEGMLPVVESVDVSQREDLYKLHGGAVGLAGVLFLTVTGAAPISAMLLNTPIAVGYGNGIGTPAGFAFATVILTIFSVGYVSMARKVTATGGFYSFISHGLGRELGMAAGLASVVAYSVFEASLCGAFAYFAVAKLDQYGHDVNWVWPALFMVALICVLAFFDVHISARILGVALICEVIVLVIFDLVVFGNLGDGGHNVQFGALNPINAFKSLPAGSHRARRSPPVPGRWACSSPSGRGSGSRWPQLRRGVEESEADRAAGDVHLGDRPRHLLHADLLGIALGVRLDGCGGIPAQTNAAQFYLGPAAKFGPQILSDAMSYLIITGSFACGMAFHNTTARYMYSLGRERVLPSGAGANA